ncbi:EamA family transporter [Rhodococcus sp. 077-4]|uniref:EamA family transporter n=1 Tax=Rhodococcus sp. 077-4 TaxID=2789271 RepID=UPI0039F52178
MASTSPSLSGASRLGIPSLFVVGALCMYVGAAIGVFLFDTVDPAAVAWLRGFGAALVLVLWRRPWRARAGSAWTRRRLLTAAAFGGATIGMNAMFYEAIARLPLGAAVAIEFLGPIAVAAAGSRKPADVCALLLVMAGVGAIASAQFEGGEVGLVGIAFALGSAALWAAYIVLGKSVADAGQGLDDMAAGFAIASVFLALPLFGPFAVAHSNTLGDWRIWVLGVGVGLLSSVVPYVLDQYVLVRVGRARFALLLALLPATATVVGAVVLTQIPTVLEALGIAAVITAVVVGGLPTRRDRGVADIPPP